MDSWYNEVATLKYDKVYTISWDGRSPFFQFFKVGVTVNHMGQNNVWAFPIPLVQYLHNIIYIYT